MTLGEKIKKARKQKGLTQSELAGEYMTRNMLSFIENGTANPSIDTLRYLSERLDITIAYLFTENDDFEAFKRAERIQKIKKLYTAGRYIECITEIEPIESKDDELHLIMAECYAQIGHRQLMNGSLTSAEVALEKAIEHCHKTIYDTTRLENKIPMYLAICKNVQAPLLEFDHKQYESGMVLSEDYEFYKYLIMDFNYNYTNETFSLHLKAKKQLRERNYGAALAILSDIVENKRFHEYNAYVMFGIYFDMENAYRQLFDFENAYRYASKRISLIEGFKT